jgi:hypothetical protein
VAQSLARHLNRVLNLTVSDARLTVSPVTGDGHDDTFELERVVEGEDVPLELYRSTARLSVQQVVVVKDRRCKTKSYEYRFQADESRNSWLMRWDYSRERPRPVYPYALAHMHIRATLPDETPIDAHPVDHHHIPCPRTPLEQIIRYLIADRGVNSKSKDWEAILKKSEKTFHS